jgi:hypothetical protein
MNAFWGGIINWAIQIFGGIIQQVTPSIAQELNTFLTNLYKKALATPSPWDDFFVGMLLDILSIPRSPPD